MDVCAGHYKVIKGRLSFVPDTSFPLDLCFFFSLFRVLPEVSAVPPRFMESRERCFLPVLVCAGPGPAGLRARLSSQESRRLARPLHSDSLPEYTQIREEATGKRRERDQKLLKEGQKATLNQLIPTLVRLRSLNINSTLWLRLHHIKSPNLMLIINRFWQLSTSFKGWLLLSRMREKSAGCCLLDR